MNVLKSLIRTTGLTMLCYSAAMISHYGSDEGIILFVVLGFGAGLFVGTEQKSD